MNSWLKHIKENLILFIVAITAMLFAIILDMFDPYLKMVIIDNVIKQGRIELLRGTLLGLVGITVGRAVFGYIKEFFFDLACSTFKLRYLLFCSKNLATSYFSLPKALTSLTPAMFS